MANDWNPPREVVGINLLRREVKGLIPEGNCGPSRTIIIHHVMVEPIRVLQKKEVSFNKSEAIPSPYLVLQFGDGEEGVGTGVALLHLDRVERRRRGGASRHLERSELAFNIKGDNPGPTSEADIVSSRWG